jgi:hypothetical protein
LRSEVCNAHRPKWQRYKDGGMALKYGDCNWMRKEFRDTDL